MNHINLSANPAYADITIKTACVTNCGATLDIWTGIHGNAIADLMAGTNNLTKMPDKSERLGLGSLLESPSTVGKNYGICVKGWLVPPVTGNFEFWIASDDNGEFWLSTVVGRLELYRTYVLLYSTYVLLARPTKVRR